MSDRASLVPLSHTLRAGTAGQTASAAGSRWDNSGTLTLKSLALKVLQRDKGRDASGTRPSNSCPTGDAGVGQDQPSVPLDADCKTEPLLMRDGRRLWRWRADAIPAVVSDAVRALADEARAIGCVNDPNAREAARRWVEALKHPRLPSF